MSLVILASALGRRMRAARSPAERAVERFAPVCRPAVARLAARDPRLADLAASFPALLHRLAVEPRRPRSHAARAAVLTGRSLKQAAAAAGLPFWTRRLPPEAFGRTSPELPDGGDFRRRIGNVLPASRRVAPAWLEAVAEAARWGEDDFTLWLARDIAGAREPRRVYPAAVRLTALFAWFSKRPNTAAGALVREPWRERLAWPVALTRARAWLREVELALDLGGREIDPWLAPGEVDGYEFRPVLTRAELVAEAEAMDNCLKSYGSAIARGDERVWSVRRRGERVACLTIERYSNEAPFPTLSEIKAASNEPAPPEVWFAARAWAYAQSPELSSLAKPCEAATIDRHAWISIWKPYWLARRRIPPEIPLGPSQDALQSLWAHQRRRRRRLRR